MNCPKCDGPMWDNRDRKRNPKAPDFKCKNKACDGVIWPDNEEILTQKQPSVPPERPAQAPQAPPARQNGWDETQAHIERQHSQEMALRYFALTGKVPTAKELRGMISWFQRDISHTPTKETEEEPF